MWPGECTGQEKVLTPETSETIQFITEEGSTVVWILQDLSLNDVSPIPPDQGCHSSWLRKQGGEQEHHCPSVRPSQPGCLGWTKQGGEQEHHCPSVGPAQPGWLGWIYGTFL